MVITGTSRDDLNGRGGVATSFDHTARRYVGELGGNGTSETQTTGKLRIKPENLVLPRN